MSEYPTEHSSGSKAQELAELQAADNRRRSQRITIAVPIRIEGLIDGTVVSRDARTEVVNRHGALLIVQGPVLACNRVLLKHSITRREAGARIVSILTSDGPRSFRLAVEVDVPSAEFWGVAFPEEVQG